MQSIRPQSYKKLWLFLKEILQPEQLKRLQQLELQHEGPAALVSRVEIVQQLNITDEQRHQCIGIVQDMQAKMEPLMEEAHRGGNQREIRLRAIKLYADQERKIESILNDVQKKQWLELYGTPFDVFNDDLG